MSGPLDLLVSVTVSTSGATPQVPNFGTPAILVYHTLNTDYIRTYSSLAGMVTDGFAVTDPAYYMASAILAQSPAPPTFKVIRGSTAAAQTMTFTVTDNTTSDSVGYQLVGTDGVSVDMYHTVAGETLAQVATAIAALADATGTTAAAVGAVVTITTTVAGKIAYIQGAKGGTFADTTAAATPATDLNNALTIDTNWYGVTGEHMDATNILAVAVWAEANKRLHAYTTADTAAKVASTGIGATLKAAAYAYSFGQWSGTPIQYGGLALAAQRFTAFPGSDTWAYKQLNGVTVDSLTATQITALGSEEANGNRLNYYIAIAGVNVTRFGICASGIYADLRRGIDALIAQIQIQVYNLLITQPKVPMDPAGIAMVGGEISSALAQFTASTSNPRALLRNDPGYAPVVILPLVANITSTDRGNRVLRNVQFVAYAQNAVQVVKITGTVNT